MVLAGFLSGCSQGAPDPNVETVGSTGTLELPLTATSAGAKYRLAKAKFVIKGQSLNFTRTITPAANTPVDQETLPVGQFQIALDEGWRLEAKGPADSDFKAVDAKLTSPNPAYFEIKRGKTIDVVFTFSSSYGTVALSSGKANVRISVQDCSSFDTLSASLATFTVECLGRIDAQSYRLSDDGYLERNFDECPLDKDMLQNIDDFLGVQYPRRALAGRPTQLDIAKECIGGRWAQWKEAFDASGITQCPDWKFEEELNTPTPDLYEKYGAALPTLPYQETGDRPSIVSQLKINTVYAVSFADGNADQNCKSPGDCAQQCAAGFPGFVLRNDGETVLTDPDPWEKQTDYNGGPNPYTRGAYYHPMSLTGELPGEIVGHWQRSQSTPKQELCSYYDYTSGLHMQTFLQPDCQPIDSTGTMSCISLCLPPIIQ